MASASPDSSNCSNVLATTTLLKSSLGSVTKIIYHYKHIKLKHIDHNCCNLYYFVCVFFILCFFRPKKWLIAHPGGAGRIRTPRASGRMTWMNAAREFTGILGCAKMCLEGCTALIFLHPHNFHN